MARAKNGKVLALVCHPGTYCPFKQVCLCFQSFLQGSAGGLVLKGTQTNEHVAVAIGKVGCHDRDDAPLVLADYVKDAGKGTRFLACLYCKLYARIAGAANGYKYPEDILIGNDASR